MATLTCGLVALLLAGSGGGTRYMETTLQDDALLLHSPAAQIAPLMRQIVALGADRVRLTASWAALAPNSQARRKPSAPFNASDSRTYPPARWQRLDRAVVAASQAGLKVQLDIAFWAPRWAVPRAGPQPDRPRYAPDPNEFGQFAEAVARRYSGTVAYPDHPRQRLPAVRLFTTWNEPNNPDFLQPQWRRTKRGGWRPESPHIYRALHNAAYDAIKRVDGRDQVLVGGTAATGSHTPGQGGVPPIQFVRELACVDSHLLPLNIPECRGYKPLRADGFAHHPYSRGMSPGQSDPDGEDVPIADIGRLETLLNLLYKTGRIASPLAVYETEYGYETGPPDPYQAVTPEQQAQYIGWSTFLAWKDWSVPMFSQFLLRDMPPLSGQRSARRAWSSMQTGLYYSDGTPKPAATAFQLPFWAELVGPLGQQAVRLFGQVRPGSGPQIVEVQRHDARGGPWQPVSALGRTCTRQGPDFWTDNAGFFLRIAPYTGPASYRLSWRRPDGRWINGVEIPVGPSALRQIVPRFG